MPIRRETGGTQEDQCIYHEYDEGFGAIGTVEAGFDGLAPRIGEGHPRENLVGRIKEEIRDPALVIVHLTDERPSCHFEAGFVRALPRPVAYGASRQSVIKPGTATKICIDIHLNVDLITNHKELAEKPTDAIETNKDRLLPADQGEADG
jgi:hypothetical protein